MRHPCFYFGSLYFSSALAHPSIHIVASHIQDTLCTRTHITAYAHRSIPLFSSSSAFVSLPFQSFLSLPSFNLLPASCFHFRSPSASILSSPILSSFLFFRVLLTHQRIHHLSDSKSNNNNNNRNNSNDDSNKKVVLSSCFPTGSSYSIRAFHTKHPAFTSVSRPPLFSPYALHCLAAVLVVVVRRLSHFLTDIHPIPLLFVGTYPSSLSSLPLLLLTLYLFDSPFLLPCSHTPTSAVSFPLRHRSPSLFHSTCLSHTLYPSITGVAFNHNLQLDNKKTNNNKLTEERQKRLQSSPPHYQTIACMHNLFCYLCTVPRLPFHIA